MARLFGTDGVRGIANVELTNALAYKLGQAAVCFLGKVIVVGKDTRKSGDMLEGALVAGITSAGGAAFLADVIPTPGVALLVRELGANGGIVISASHNPPEYNGIKFFDGEGYKLPDAMEDDIQKFVEGGGLEGMVEALRAEGEDASMPAGDFVGISYPIEDACETYIAHAVKTVTDQDIDFSGMTVALDTGHGASSLTSAEALTRLGAKVYVINDDFDGVDINVGCGSTHLEPLQALVAEVGADVGIAHDGDADRVMVVTPSGAVADGDVMEAVLALDMKERGVLYADTAVTTVMANLGFKNAMAKNGINMVCTSVGDRYVLEEMRMMGYKLGGEQSGHMILMDYNTTGDGLVTALQFLAAVRRSGKTVDEAIKVFDRYPQVLINVRVADKNAVFENADVLAAKKAAEAALGSEGRVLLRASGTEPVIRVMVEAASEEMANEHAEAIAAVVAKLA